MTDNPERGSNMSDRRGKHGGRNKPTPAKETTKEEPKEKASKGGKK